MYSILDFDDSYGYLTITRLIFGYHLVVCHALYLFALVTYKKANIEPKHVLVYKYSRLVDKARSNYFQASIIMKRIQNYKFGWCRSSTGISTTLFRM